MTKRKTRTQTKMLATLNLIVRMRKTLQIALAEIAKTHRTTPTEAAVMLLRAAAKPKRKMKVPKKGTRPVPARKLGNRNRQGRPLAYRMRQLLPPGGPQTEKRIGTVRKSRS